MVASAGQLLAAGLHRGSERRVVLLLVAGARATEDHHRGAGDQELGPHRWSPPPGSFWRQVSIAARNVGLSCCSWPAPRNCPLASGSGKSGRPLSRMHSDNSRIYTTLAGSVLSRSAPG